jgi:hypothetical protein
LAERRANDLTRARERRYSQGSGSNDYPHIIRQKAAACMFYTARTRIG